MSLLKNRHNLYFWDNVNNSKSYCDFFDTVSLSKDTFDHYSSWSLFEYKLMLELFMNCLLRFKTNIKGYIRATIKNDQDMVIETIQCPTIFKYHLKRKKRKKVFNMCN